MADVWSFTVRVQVETWSLEELTKLTSMTAGKIKKRPIRPSLSNTIVEEIIYDMTKTFFYYFVVPVSLILEKDALKLGVEVLFLPLFNCHPSRTPPLFFDTYHPLGNQW